jgi:hypothetical protein
VDIHRFFLNEIEVTEARWIEVERASGFWVDDDDHDLPIAGGFHVDGHPHGTYFTVDTNLIANSESTCASCDQPVVKVNEMSFTNMDRTSVYRHVQDGYPHRLGSRACNATTILPNSWLSHLTAHERDETIVQALSYLIERGYHVSAPTLAGPRGLSLPVHL